MRRNSGYPFMHYMQARFYEPFNSIFRSAGRIRNESVTPHLVSAYWQPQLPYVNGSYGNLNVTVTEIWSLQHTSQWAVSLHISGQNVNFVCGLMDDKSLDTQINARRIKFVNSKTCINIIIIMLFYTNCTCGLAKANLGYLNGTKISSIGGGGRGPRGPPSKYAHAYHNSQSYSYSQSYKNS